VACGTFEGAEERQKSIPVFGLDY